jgi:hypothetical protein
MTIPNDAQQTTEKPVAFEPPADTPVARLLFSGATLAGAVVACAIAGPKIPPWAGE